MRPRIRQRRRIFLGCEGESEQGYGALLQKIADAHNRAVHIDAVLLRPGGGDPLALVELAINRLEDKIRKREAYAARFILLDSDTLHRSPDRDRRATLLAEQNDITLIWQEPSFEALLLRHLAGQENRLPSTSSLALEALLQQWPEYRKPMSAVRLAARIDIDGIRRVARRLTSLQDLLTTLGL